MPQQGRKPRKYVAKDGSISWRVRYRSSAGTEKSETFYDEESADEFAGLLRAIGPTRAIAYIDNREKEGGGSEALSFADIFEKWFAWKSASKNGRPIHVRSGRTLDDYRRMYESRIRPQFGDRPANMIGTQDVQDWIDGLGTELEAKTIADYHSLLHAVYLWALEPGRNLVVGDPCQSTTLPKRVKKPPKGLRPQEWHILHQAAREVEPAAADLLQFMVASQWRWSECVAVQVMAVDHWEQDGESFTYVTMGRVLRREGHSFVFVEDAKSTAGKRRTRIKGAAEQMILRRIEGKRPDDLILTNATGRRWNYTHFHQRYWTRPPNPANDDAPKRKRILERAAELGLRRPGLTPHWLRHTGVGMLILAGEPLTAISRRVGHASIKTTADVYGRMVDDTSSAGLDRAALLMDGPVVVPPALPPATS